MKVLQRWRMRRPVFWYLVLLVLAAIAGILVHMVPRASASEATGYLTPTHVSDMPLSLSLQHIADVPLGGDTTRFDYESFDPTRHLLFVAHLGDSHVIAFDTQTSRVVGRVGNVASVHGVLAIPELGRVYATATGTREVVAIDMATLAITARLPTGAFPNGMAYAPEAHKLYVSDQSAGALMVVDVRSNTPVATIPLGGEVGNTQYDPVSKHIFVNVQTRGLLAEIDPATDRIVALVNVPGARRNHGLLIDPDDRLAFLACQGNDTLLALDMRTMRPVSSFHLGGGPDVLAYDQGLHLLYVAGEAGVLSLFRVKAGVVAKVGEGDAGPNAHVVAVDPATHRAYLPLMDVDGQTEMRIFAARR
ncbi:YncE family protein [Paraburkholderia sp. SARCC-3016]|uniref:YncE family protein n=1 Tax=Paraburkholderia sp. SARCC-3016 TaxID=3058611 RepID=UPI0028070E67|nr:YncE family protein [Paraburkholderia sp. SARCC-3016]MDQ7979888.1 YncE family protein [Paraburkholderia sp. SARCC-3016]